MVPVRVGWAGFCRVESSIGMKTVIPVRWEDSVCWEDYSQVGADVVFWNSFRFPKSVPVRYLLHL
jgi:hypothetical protein